MECYNANPSWIMFNGQKIWQSRFCVLCRYLSSHNGVPRQLSVWSQCSLKIGWFFTGISVFLFLYSWLSCTFKKEYLFEEDEVYANFKLDFFFIIVPEVFDHNFFFWKRYICIWMKRCSYACKKYAEIPYFCFTPFESSTPIYL